MTRDRIRVAAVPSGHPYVRAISADEAITTLADPVPDPAHPDRWWPPVMLDGAWIEEHRREFDVMHVHFGMESLPEGRLRGAIAALLRAKIPLVYTVHDLVNPQLRDQRAHRRDLDLLIPAASALITLTDAAADSIRDGWGRAAEVIAHPTLALPAVPTCEAHGDLAPGDTVRTIGVHLRDLRANIDAERATDGLLAAVAHLERARAVVFMNDSVRDARAAQRIRSNVGGLGHAELVLRPRPSDDALIAEIDRLDVAVLPYSHGTHSGWVELCYDRGVPVVGAANLAAARQHPLDYFSADLAGPAEAIRDALERATPPHSAARRDVVQTRRVQRAEQAAAVARRHAAIYRQVTAW